MIRSDAPTSTEPVPRSGWSIISPKAAPITASGGSSPLVKWVMRWFSSDNSLDKNRIMQIFINSDG
ncbi:hypothetical protein D3C75_977020 [compost metagenome]